MPIIDQSFRRGDFVGGEEILAFEKKVSQLCEVKYAVALNSGTDALTLALRLLDVGPGDEVITAPNSFIASAAAIVHLDAKPVFVDVLDDQNIDPSKLEGAITKNTKAIMPVHLTGRMCEMDEIMDIAEKHSIGCFSAHPLKNLNAFGDAGFLTTNSKEISEKAKLLANHGLKTRDVVETFGFVSRMDTLQAVILNFHLDNLEAVISRRKVNASIYSEILNPKFVTFSKARDYALDTFHTFVIQVDKRDALKDFLASEGIGTSIHYPIPIHLQPAASELKISEGTFPVTEKQSKRILTLPVNQYLSEEEIDLIAKKVNYFFEASVNG